MNFKHFFFSEGRLVVFHTKIRGSIQRPHQTNEPFANSSCLTGPLLSSILARSIHKWVELNRDQAWLIYNPTYKCFCITKLVTCSLLGCKNAKKSGVMEWNHKSDEISLFYLTIESILSFYLSVPSNMGCQFIAAYSGLLGNT